MMDYYLRPLIDEDMDRLFTWRNSEAIRINMFNDRVIPYEEHIKWFEEILTHAPKYFRIFMYVDEPIGFISFKKHSLHEQECWWGFYIGAMHAPKGSGRIMGIYGLNYAFNTLRMNKVIGEVLESNERSIKFHLKLGFSLENESCNRISRNNSWLNVIQFGLHKHHWESEVKKINGRD